MELPPPSGEGLPEADVLLPFCTAAAAAVVLPVDGVDALASDRRPVPPRLLSGDDSSEALLTGKARGDAAPPPRGDAGVASPSTPSLSSAKIEPPRRGDAGAWLLPPAVGDVGWSRCRLRNGDTLRREPARGERPAASGESASSTPSPSLPLPEPVRARPSLNDPALPVSRLTAVAVPAFLSFGGLLRRIKVNYLRCSSDAWSTSRDDI